MAAWAHALSMTYVCAHHDAMRTGGIPMPCVHRHRRRAYAFLLMRTRVHSSASVANAPIVVSACPRLEQVPSRTIRSQPPSNTATQQAPSSGASPQWDGTLAPRGPQAASGLRRRHAACRSWASSWPLGSATAWGTACNTACDRACTTACGTACGNACGTACGTAWTPGVDCPWTLHRPLKRLAVFALGASDCSATGPLGGLRGGSSEAWTGEPR